MQHHIRHSKVDSRIADELVQDFSKRRLTKLLQQFASDQVHLYTTVERTADRSVRVGCRLALPSGVLVTRATGADVTQAVDAAFHRLTRRLRRHLDRLRRNDAWKRRGRRERLRRFKTALAARPYDERMLYCDLLARHLGIVTQLVTRELAYLQAAGHLEMDWPEVEDVVDEVFVRSLRELPARPRTIDLGAWLTRASVEVINEMLGRSRADVLDAFGPGAERVSLDPHGTEGLDVTADSATSDPTEMLAAEELRKHVIDALKALPIRWRRIVMLRYVDDQPVDRVAAVLNLDAKSVQRVLDDADVFLREKMLERGIDLPSPGLYAEYAAALPDSGYESRELAEELEQVIKAIQAAADSG